MGGLHFEAVLEKACLTEASHWFTQASNTPFLMAPLIDFSEKLAFDPRHLNRS